LGIDSPFETDLNLYAYVRGQALKNIDPLGLSDTKAQNADAADRRERGTEAYQNGAAAGRFQYGLDQAYAAARDDILNRPTPQASQGGAEGASGVEEPGLKQFEAQQRSDHAALDAWYAKHNQHVGAPLSETYNKGYDAGYRGAQIDERTKTALSVALTALPVGRIAATAAVRARGTPILFGQASVKSTFAHGPFTGRTIGQVAADLRAGKASADLLPVEVVVRNGQTVALNNRSLLTLRRAGVEPTKVIDRTGDTVAERLLDSHLRGGMPSDVIRVRGMGSGASLVE
jgi:hypothetical protein